MYSFSVRVGLLLSSSFLLAFHYLSGMRWSDFSLVLPLAVGSFAAGSAAARLVNFGFRGKNAPLGHNALIGVALRVAEVGLTASVSRRGARRPVLLCIGVVGCGAKLTHERKPAAPLQL